MLPKGDTQLIKTHLHTDIVVSLVFIMNVAVQSNYNNIVIIKRNNFSVFVVSFLNVHWGNIAFDSCYVMLESMFFYGET